MIIITDVSILELLQVSAKGLGKSYMIDLGLNSESVIDFTEATNLLECLPCPNPDLWKSNQICKGVEKKGFAPPE